MINVNTPNGIAYVGVSDHDITLFEAQYTIANGMAYNSYLIYDEKIAVMDTVEASFGEEWLSNIEAALDGRSPDYLVVQHMEPDHSANITRFMDAYPNACIVSSAKAFTMMANFYGEDYADRRVVVKEGSELSLGASTLTFVGAPMVHWPEVIVTYHDATKTLFSADGFGKFGALDTEEEWTSGARRYYFGIVGKYGKQVQSLLKKASGLDIATICPLHGPVLSENLAYYLDLYQTWSSYEVESDGVAVAACSVYGHTMEAARELVRELEAAGCPKVAFTDLVHEDPSEAVEDAFQYGTLVLAAPTYNAGVFPAMRSFIDSLVERGYQNRRVAFIENGSWAPMAAKTMRERFGESKGIEFIEESVTVTSALNDDSRAQIKALANAIMRS